MVAAPEVIPATKVTASDPEKGAIESAASPTPSSRFSSDKTHTTAATPKPVTGAFKTWNDRIESLAGLEARGITRVMPDERHEATLMGYFQMAFLWFSANLTANNLAVGFLGPLLFELGFVDAALCSVFGAFVGSLMTSYMSIWGAQSGNRTMVGYY